MKRHLLWLVVVSAIWVGDRAGAQEPNTILTIDSDALFETSLFGKSTEAEFRQLRADLIRENQQLEAELIAEEQSLAEQRQTMSAEEFRPLAEAFDAKVQQIRADQEEKLRDLTTDRDASRQAFFQQVIPMVADIVRERGALVVIDRRTVFLSAESVDITNVVIERLDEAFEAGELTLPDTDPGDPPDPGQPPEE